VADVEMTTRFASAVGMEGVRLIREDAKSHPEEATIQAIRRLITGESAAPAPAAAPGKKKNKKKDKKKGTTRG
jgi:hypothetical protein